MSSEPLSVGLFECQGSSRLSWNIVRLLIDEFLDCAGILAEHVFLPRGLLFWDGMATVFASPILAIPLL